MTWLDEFVEFAQAQLCERAMEGYWDRGVSEKQIRDFKLGYIKNTLPNLPSEASEFTHWSTKGPLLEDVFVFPLTNVLGEVRGLQFRSVDREQKGYRTFYNGKQEPVLFGLGQSAEFLFDKRAIFVVEGVFDLFPVQRAIPWVVATLTARVSRNTVRLLKRLVSDIWLGYDLDSTGREACERFEKYNGHTFDVHVFAYPGVSRSNGSRVKDLNDLWDAWGDDKLVPFVLDAVGGL